jgi:hypothetical protein
MSDNIAIWQLMSYLDPNCNANMNFESGSLGLTFGPITMYKWISGNDDWSIHILNLYVSTWLLIILVTLTLGWLLSIQMVKWTE